MKGTSACEGFIPVLILGIGLACVHKLNASCDECCEWKMKCEYPGKTGIIMGSLTKSQPIIIIPSPKHKSLEV